MIAEQLTQFLTALRETLIDVAPILAVILGFQLLILRKRVPNAGRVLKGTVCVVLGLVFFLMGLEQALFPLGRAMAEQLTAPEHLHGIQANAEMLQVHWTDYYAVYLFALTMGSAVVLVEPAVIAVALKANQLSAGAIRADALRVVIALGVGMGIAVASFRIVTGGSLYAFIIGAYGIVVVQTFFAPRNMIPLAYDAGGVSTSTVTVPVVAALGLGLAASIPGRSPLIDGFGMIAFAVICPVISVLAYAQFAQWRNRHTS